jgi:predicted nucleic acid-binding protein
VRVAIDSSVLVGLLVPGDAWHLAGEVLLRTIHVAGHRPVYLDCVVTESASTVLRRLREKRQEQVGQSLDRLARQVPLEEITWAMPDVPVLYAQALDLMRSSDGELNFNDALIALTCRDRGISAIASFDADFDRVPWLQRWARPEDVTP